MFTPILRETNKISTFLAQDFENRKAKKKNYSLRSYAQFLGLSPSTLHSLMNEKIPGSPKIIRKVAKKIGLTADEQEYFSHIAELRQKKNPLEKADLRRRSLVLNTRFNTINEQEFEDVAQWYHYPVMEIIKTKNASTDPAWIAKKLGITPTQATHALELLVKLGTIEFKPNGQLIIKRDYIEFPSGAPVESARKQHQTMIDKARVAVEKQPKGTRNFSSTVLRFRKDEIQKVDEFISQFRREFCQKFEEGTDHDSVYSLCVQFFRLDHD